MAVAPGHVKSLMIGRSLDYFHHFLVRMPEHSVADFGWQH